MANEVAFGGARPAAVFGNQPVAESLADGIGAGFTSIGIKGKVWSLRHRGERHVFTRADDGSPSNFLDVVILRQLPVKSKSYYPKDSFNDDTSAGIRPICASLDGITPDIDVQEQQSSACAICPRNVVKINEKGRKERDCRDYKRLAVLIVPKLTKQLLGSPLLEPVYLKVPAASLSALNEFGGRMSQAGWNYWTFVTRIGFVMEAAHPQLTFKEHVVLNDEEGKVVNDLRQDPLALRITGENEYNKPKIAINPVTTIIPPNVYGAGSAGVARSAPVEDDSGFGADEPVVRTNTPRAGESAKQTAARTAPRQPVVIDNDEDVGIDEASSDLDARVAAILKTQ